MDLSSLCEEEKRLLESHLRQKNWKRWGPYLSERQWATVREDYSTDGSCWTYFPHDHARSRAYRWGEDGLLGITDRECRLCFSLCLWNEKDPILKERLYGLTEGEGNHAEDVKEVYFYLDSSPTHSYMKALYKYPQKAFPYQKLLEENEKRGLDDPEYELMDTGIFDNGEYFDVFVEYAKADENDLLVQVTIYNRSAKTAPLHFLPTLWFRNSWSWGCDFDGCTSKPFLRQKGEGLVETIHPTLGTFYFAYDSLNHEKFPQVIYTENHTNQKRLYNVANANEYVKDSFHDYVIHGEKAKVNPDLNGTKCAPYYLLSLQPQEKIVLKFRLFSKESNVNPIFDDSFESIFQKRKEEADEFYQKKIPESLSDEEKEISRQAYAGLLWSKQFYHYVVTEWIKGDPNLPKPPPERKAFARNSDWVHFFARDVISMPDKWEYPWFAAWDLGFHMITFAKIDADFAKSQIVLFLREWYMHPNGQQPAYEFAFSDVNPPVHAWAAWRIYKMTGKKGERDIEFLESVFQKLLINFTWWVNRKDLEGNHLFAGGFLGLDNIGVFNRSISLPMGGALRQADGTAWMAFYCLTMLTIALELASHDQVYEDLASKFFEHFIRIVDAINMFGGNGLWDDVDGFYYDQLRLNENQIPLRSRSLVGLIPLIAVETLEEEHITKLQGFRKRMDWFLKHRGDLESVITYCKMSHQDSHRLLAIPSKEKLVRILRYVLDEKEFLSPYGIRSMSKIHKESPFRFQCGEQSHVVEYCPGESTSNLYGGNSNWRGPIWFPINFLIIEALERYDHFYGSSLKVECPVGSGIMKDLNEVAKEISSRLCNLFRMTENGRPCIAGIKEFKEDPHWKNLLLFHEYFHGDTGKGLGACHQTGWTSLIAKLLEDRA